MKFKVGTRWESRGETYTVRRIYGQQVYSQSSSTKAQWLPLKLLHKALFTREIKIVQP